MKRLISKLQLARDQFRRWLGIQLFDRQKTFTAMPETLSRIVFLRWDAKWGDAIVSSFIFDALRQHFPNIQIEAVTTPQMADLFKNDYQLDRVYEIPKRPTYAQLKSLAQEIGKIDALVHMSPTLKMKDLYFLNQIDAHLTIGLDDAIQHFNIPLGQKSKGLHFSEKFNLILKSLNIHIDHTQYQVPLREDSLNHVRQFLTHHHIKNFIAFNPFGSGKARKLSPETIGKMIDEIKSIDHNKIIILLHSPETKNLVADLCQQYQGQQVYYDPDSRSIYDAIALIQHADQVISVDTSIVHIAAGLNKPLLAIYNPDDENYASWHPNHSDAISFFADPVIPPNINALNEDGLNKKLLQLISPIPKILEDAGRRQANESP